MRSTRDIRSALRAGRTLSYALCLAPIALVARHGAAASQHSQELPMTGQADPAFKSFDDTIIDFMRRRNVPGGAVAVVKAGRLVYTRGYGWADTDAEEPVQPGSLFRIASISKPFTAAAVMALVQSGRLSLDARAFPLLGLHPTTGGDPRLNDITVLELLQHTGGWDRDRSGDPMFDPIHIAGVVGAPAPADQHAIIHYMLGRPLDNDPGTHYAYSNFGYCVLGRIIEHVSGMSYETYVQRHVLEPLGITRMRLGHTQLKDRAPGEVRYYQPNLGPTRSVFPAAGAALVPYCYGGFNIEAMDSHGGWIASAVDLARFAARLDVPDGRALLDEEMTHALYARPEAPVGWEADGSPSPAYYACGWSVRPVGTEGRANRWHTGSLPGTFTILVRRSDGLTWVALFNQRSENGMPSDDELDAALHRAADAVKVWPDYDLFPNYR